MKHVKNIFVALFCFFLTNYAVAQINPMNAQLFQNQYLANPAKAGAETGARLNLGYKNQWSSIPGTPHTSLVSYDARTNKVGLGLTVLNEKAGLLNFTKVMGTYAYHLPLSGTNEFLHMGVSLGFFKGNLSTQDLVGDPNDQQVQNFNSRELVLDGDAGFAYTSERFGVEAVIYNLKSQLKNDLKNTVDNNTSYFAMAYTFPLSDWKLQSKIAYRGVRNYTDIVDFGVNAQSSDEKIDFNAVYHSNKSISAGVGYVHHKQWQILGLYTTGATPINAYVNGTFEIGLKVNLLKK